MNRRLVFFISARARQIILSAMVSVLAVFCWNGNVHAACSAYAGDATFNEYYFGTDTNFLEMYINNINNVPQATWQNWTIRVYTAPGVYTEYVLNDTTSTYCPFGNKAYVTFDVGGGLPSTPVSVALLDASGNEVDYLDACGPPAGCTLPAYYTPDPGVCSATDHDVYLDSLGNKDIARFPDGTGAWAISGGTGSGTSYTSCTTNNAGVAKVSSVSSIAIGSNFDFTVTALNNSKKDETFTIEDNIPAGFTYVSSVPSQGSVDVSALPLLVWNVGSVAKDGGIASLTITVTGSVLGTHNNTAVLTAPCSEPDPLDCPRDSASVVVVAPSSDHFDINHDTTAINCQAEPVTIEAHAADHTVETGYTGTLNLSTSTGNGDWTLITGAGVLNNGAADDGAASYSMVAGDNGVVVLGLKDTTVESVNINVSDGSISETTGTALASEDQNLVFSQSGFVFLADSVASSIGTQIGGKASSFAPGNQVLELQAIRTSDTTGACEAVLQGVTPIELAFECRNPTTCSANQVNIDGGTPTTIAGNPLGPIGSYTPVDLDFGNAADTTATFVMNYPDVGEIQLYARYNIPLDDGSGTPSGIFMTGNSNAFVSRPFGFNVVAAGNPAATGPAGAPFTTAGTDFSVSATAVLYQAGDDADSDGVPDNHADTDPSNNADLSNNTAALNYGQESPTENLTLSALLNQPGGGNDPGLQGTTSISSFTNGVGSTAAARYDEVGIVEITANVADADYLGIGLPATTNLLGKSGYVGRFYPNHFAIANPVVTNRVALACAPASIFTYMGENYRIAYDLQVWSADPTGPAVPVQTQNYTAAFAKLDPAVLANMNYGATDSGTNYTARLSVASVGVFAAGVAPVQATLALTRNATPDGAYPNFEVGIAPADSDSVALLPGALDLSLDGGPNTHGLLGQTDIRYGRLVLQNNFGSELLPLSLPLTTDYYLDATSEFVTNSDDSCTSIAIADVLLYNDQEPKAGRALANPVIVVNGAATTTLDPVAAFVTGVSSLDFSAPGVEGYVDVEIQTPSYLLSDLDGIDQGIQGPGLHCTPGLAGTDPAFIAACVADGNNVDDIPLGRANFGIFKGSDNVIYTREVYY